jgi:mono/diheme cytochrome c family protein
MTILDSKGVDVSVTFFTTHSFRTTRQHWLAVVLCFWVANPCRSQERPPSMAADVGIQTTVRPFVKTHCERCHGPTKQEGNFRVDQHLKNEFLDPAAKAKWGEVVNMLNSHEMPPEGEPQPRPEEVAKVVDWITEQMVRAELVRRDGQIVLRRLNRDDYRNTIRDLIGIDFDMSAFPLDPPAGGFDNNGKALTMSPLLTELYLDTARKILDRALVEGDQPPAIKWRFEIDSGDNDSNRKIYDKQNVIVNGGNNPVKDGFKVLHHDNWDKHLNARGYALKHEGDYIIRIRAAGFVPKREAVVESARKALQDRFDKQMQQNPKGEKYHREQMERDLKHFATDRMYDFGPPRLKLIQHLGGQPKVLAEFDVDASFDKPREYEVRARFTTEQAGLTIEYAYAIPRVLENFWFQSHDSFARPELYVDWFELEGPIYESWPPPSHRRLLGVTSSSPLQGEGRGEGRAENDSERQQARDIIARFLRLAYRRPVTVAEIDEKLKLFDLVRADSPSFVQAIKTPLIAAMASPHFLYLAEPVAHAARVRQSSATTANRTSTDAREPRALQDHELAARLSYFLWSSMPDGELSKLADTGKLRDSKTLTAQVNRMLADDKSEAFVRNFAGQWLGLREVGANPPASDLYPQYDRHLETSIVEESRAFFAEILKHDLSVLNFVGSDFVVINERLARFYGIPDVRGDEFRRVAVPDGVHRGGIVTQASMLTITSNGTRTSPVKRGTWVLKNVLGIDPGLPVANAGDIAPKVPGIDKATVRKRLEIHRTLPQCARCHSKIDPLGFALENFNAAGEWREQEGFGYKGRIERNDPKIDAASKLPDGTAIDGVDELRTVLRQREDLFLNCLASKLLTYALGRELGIADQPTVKAAVEQSKKNGYTLRSLIQFIATSEPFGSK